MMRCDRSQDLFARAWDDELSVSERESLEAHWGACASCRRAYDEYARTLELVQTLPRPVVSTDFAARVLREARRREAETRSVSRLGRSGWAFGLAPRPAMALAAAFAVALGIGAIARFAPWQASAPAPLVATTVEPKPSSPAPSLASEPTVAPSQSQPSELEPARVATVAPAASRTSREPIPRPATSGSTPSANASAAHVSAATAEMAAVPDSLFDHTADVELVLDPVQLRRERGRGYTPVQTTVRGEAASITF